MTKILRSILSALFVLAGLYCYAQAPVLTYGSINYYYLNVNSPATIGPSVTGSAPGTGTFINLRSALESNLTAVTADAAGNVYYAANGSNSVAKIPVTGHPPVTVASGFNQPNGIAADTAGNIYVADFGNQSIKKIQAIGGAVVQVLSGNISPYGIAVDKGGNVFFSDWISGSIKKIPAGGGAVTSLGSGFDSPTGVAVDNLGNVFVTDRGHNLIKKIDAGGVVSTLAAGNGSLNGIAVDAAGNVYFSDANNTTLIKIPKNGGSLVSVGSGFSQPAGLCISASGDIFVNDAGHLAIKELQASNFEINGVLPVGLNFNVNTGVISGTPTVIAAIQTYGVSVVNEFGRSFAYVYIIITPELPIITYKTPTIFTVNEPITPLVPVNTGGPADKYFLGQNLVPGLIFNSQTGVLSGTPTLTRPATDYTVTVDGPGGRVTAKFNMAIIPQYKPVISYNTPHIYKVDTVVAPLTPVSSYVAALGDPKLVTAATGLSYLSAVAVDEGGNIYFSQLQLNTVKKIPAGGGNPIILASGFNAPAGVAADGQGNVYVADSGNNAIKKIAAGGTVTTVATGFNGPSGLALDTDGNIYVTNLGNGLLQKVPAGGGSPVTIGPVFQHPTGVAIDGAGNIYVSDNSSNLIQKIPVRSNSAVTLVSGINNPSGVAVDVAGNVFYTELNAGDIKEFPVSGGGAITVASGLNSPYSLAIDTKHVIYTNDVLNDAVKEFAPQGGFFINKALPAGLAFDYNTGTISGTPTATSPATDYTIVAYNKYGVTPAIVNIKTINGGDLSSLQVSTGALSPMFATARTNYTVNLPNVVTSLQITPLASEANSTITVNGVAVISGSPSASLPLTVGANIITTVVTAQYGTSNRTYTVTANRAAANLSTNATLTTIKLNPATTLAAVAGSGYKNYAAVVPNTESSFTIAAIPQEVHATIKINGIATASGVASSAIPLNVGANVISIKVTAQDSATTKNYIITLTRAPSSVATLSNLSTSSAMLSPVFSAATTSYTAIVPNATSSIKITPTVSNAGATVKVNGAIVTSGSPSDIIPLIAGPNTITTVVTAQDGVTTQTYTTTITRAAADLSTDAILTHIKLTPATTLAATTGPGYKNYTATVPNSEGSVTVAVTAEEAHATITINGMATASGMASPAIPLNIGANIVNIVVTAQDSATTKNYIITLTRAPSSIATLSNLSVNVGTLSPVFASATTAYTAIVPNATSSIKITPTVTDAAAAIKVNGTTLASGIASASLPLVVGTNTITTIVTAQDGTTTKTYTVTVTRAAAGLSTDAILSHIKLTPASTLAAVTGTGYKNYAATVPYTESSVTVAATAEEVHATIFINGAAVASGAASPAIPLSVGNNVIRIIVTAQDGATTKSYIITLTRAALSMTAQYAEAPADGLKADGVIVHQGLSPNGDGDNDVMVIDNIERYPDNKIIVMNRSGGLVYEAAGYNNISVAFDGHSNKNGKLQQAGTYFYKLDYKDRDETKTKTGFILLKY